MSNVNNILKKIAKAEKIELAKHHVELESLQDYSNIVGSLIDSRGMAVNKVRETAQIFKSAISDLERGIKLANQAINMGINIEKQAKDLGVDLPSKFKSTKDRNILELEEMKKLEILYNRISSEIQKA
jgi:hypothetical protein